MEMHACLCKMPCLYTNYNWGFGFTIFSAGKCLASGNLRAIQLRTALSDLNSVQISINFLFTLYNQFYCLGGLAAP